MMPQAVAIIGLIIAAGSAAYQISEAEQAKKRAKKQRDTQLREARRQAALREAAARRQARVRRAVSEAQQAAGGGGGSIAQGLGLGIESATAAQISEIGSALGAQETQFDIQLEQTAAAADVQVGQSLGNFAATALTPTGPDQTSLVERALGE